ncbi:MAG: KamA family radical SAM protein [Ruminococcaceae bacterium]|nr:KamA family radical SAM protein [Oscillospiraceae bacterium]
MSWTDELKNGIRTAEQLAQVLNLNIEQKKRYAEIIERFPMLITPYYLSLVDLSDPLDPIGKMCIPSIDEFDLGGSFDTSGEKGNTKLTGLQHKYRQTALLLSTNECAMYCRHCFRKRLVGLSDDELNRRLEEAVLYIKNHEEISNVLVSGGDAFLNSNAVIEKYLNELCSIPHLDFIRFGSRTPVTLPERIYGDSELLSIFSNYAKKKSLILVTQFNHPREITKQAVLAVESMINCGVSVRNQTVLLKGVNDNPEVLAELLRGLTSISAFPYYIFQCRPVTGVKGQFQVPILDGIKIVDAAKSLQNGVGKNIRYAMSHPRGKIEIIGNLPNGETIFKFHQNMNTEDSAKIFTTRLKSTDTWLDYELSGCDGD